MCQLFGTSALPGFSVVPEATHKVSPGAASAQKALQGLKRETRELLGGRERKSKVFPNKSMIFHEEESKLVSG